MPGIKPAVADRLKVFFRDMPDETLNKFNGRECFLYISTVFMAVVMKSDILPVIMVNAGGCNYGPAKISADIFDNGIRVTFVRFCEDIETIFILLVAECFRFFKGRTDFSFHFIKKYSAESIA